MCVCVCVCVSVRAAIDEQVDDAGELRGDGARDWRVSGCVGEAGLVGRCASHLALYLTSCLSLALSLSCL